ncbi:MAG TPA: creatininase family protein, partial [Gemmatimonadaceae bacterium]|nr:creatininase family protein [Gemmatimonadaceae bacterium]
GNQEGMKTVAEKLNQEWKGSGFRAHFIGDYYTKSQADIRKYLVGRGFAESDVGSHAGMTDTSELMAIDPSLIRMDKRAPGGGFENSGVSGDPSKATPELGRELLKIKIDNGLAQIRASLAEKSQ